MKLLLFSDLHTDTTAAQELVVQSRDVDLVIGAGDFGSVRRNVASCFDVLRQINKPALLVPGNNESLEELVRAAASWPHAQVLHGTSIVIGGVPFFGLGCAVPPTPFGDWSCDLPEEEAERMLSACPPGAVLISHSPPHGVVDVSSQQKHLGSTSVRDAILQKDCRLCVCGHIHDCAGQVGRLGNTPVVNAGPAGMAWLLTGEN